jgi:chemotaxis protein methyltransferase CheR
MTPSTFDGLRGLIHSEAGIALRPGREALLKARLARRLRELSLADERAYFHFVRNDTTGQELTRMLDAVSTNVTSFFREADHFAFIVEALRARIDEGSRRLRLWSAGCSTGEEPCSLAMSILGNLDCKKVDLRILATDLSTSVLARARRGLYSASDVQNIPSGTLAKFFEHDSQSGCFQIDPTVRQRISYEHLNLADAPYPMQGPLDAVLCRNVMIYFSMDAKQRMISEVERLLRPGGLFVIGHSETLHGLSTELRLVRPSVYRKPFGPDDAS